MTFKRLAEYFFQLESTSLRNKMTEILASLFKEADKEEIGNLCYLLQGRVAPLFEAIEFGVADKMVIRAISQGLDFDQKEVIKGFKKEGDLGKATEYIKNKKSNIKNTYKKLNINDVYAILYEIATSSGKGSQEQKIKLLGNLLKDIDSLSARYIVRIALAKLRLGFSDMTMLDALSWMLNGTKELKPTIERAYNVRPDLGYISETVKRKGIKGLDHVQPKVGTPILMARAERLTTPEEIIEKVGECAIEPKLDGFRLQVHYQKHGNAPRPFRVNLQGEPPLKIRGGEGELSPVRLFSRNLENVTFMYPDIVDGVKKEIKAKEAIFEGEAIGVDTKTGRYLPFQETVQRKRKYAIEEMVKKIPLKLIAFDLLFLDGESLINRPFIERRRRLEKIIG